MNKHIRETETAGPDDRILRDLDQAGGAGRDTGRTAALMQAAAIGYWLVFWAMNGLDKFLHRTDLGLMTWYGKDRTGQFAGYFENMGVSADFIAPVLIFAGVWEIAVAVPLLLALLLIATGRRPAGFSRLVDLGFFLSAATMIAFSIFDVVAGDRAELREHGLYLILIFVCWTIAAHGSGRVATKG